MKGGHGMREPREICPHCAEKCRVPDELNGWQDCPTCTGKGWVLDEEASVERPLSVMDDLAVHLASVVIRCSRCTWRRTLDLLSFTQLLMENHPSKGQCPECGEKWHLYAPEYAPE
jgi:hypothetical protein